MINPDRRTTVREIADKLDISVSTVHGILTEELGMSKVSARWVPQLLKDSEKDCLCNLLLWLYGVHCLSKVKVPFLTDQVHVGLKLTLCKVP